MLKKIFCILLLLIREEKYFKWVNILIHLSILYETDATICKRLMRSKQGGITIHFILIYQTNVLPWHIESVDLWVYWNSFKMSYQYFI